MDPNNLEPSDEQEDETLYEIQTTDGSQLMNLVNIDIDDETGVVAKTRR